MHRSPMYLLLSTPLSILFASLASAQVKGIASNNPYESSVANIPKSSYESGVKNISANNYESSAQSISSPASTSQVSPSSSSAGASSSGGSSTSSGTAATSPTGSEPTKAEDGSPSQTSAGTGKFFTCTRCGIEGAETKGYCLGAFGMLSDTNGKAIHHINK